MSRKRWSMMAGVFAAGAALAAAAATVIGRIGRRRGWGRDDPFSIVDSGNRGGEFLLNSIHHDSGPSDAGMRMPDVVVPVSAADGKSAMASLPSIV
jgi:hypothetical protein